MFLLTEAKEIIREMPEVVNLIGYVRKDNIASMKCFRKACFQERNEYIERYFAIDGENKKMFLFIWNREMKDEKD